MESILYETICDGFAVVVEYVPRNNEKPLVQSVRLRGSDVEVIHYVRRWTDLLERIEKHYKNIVKNANT